MMKVSLTVKPKYGDIIVHIDDKVAVFHLSTLDVDLIQTQVVEIYGQ